MTSALTAITRNIAAWIYRARETLFGLRPYEKRVEDALAGAQRAMEESRQESERTRQELERTRQEIEHTRQESASLTGHVANIVDNASFELTNRITHVETELSSRVAELAANQQTMLAEISVILGSTRSLHREIQVHQATQQALAKAVADMAAAADRAAAANMAAAVERAAAAETAAAAEMAAPDVPDFLEGSGADASRRALWTLEGIESVGGHCFKARLPENSPQGDSAERSRNATTMLLENGVPLGPPHSQHDAIAESGRGQYSYWEDTVYFSSSDGSDPRFNGRKYHLVLSSLMTGAEWRRQVASAFDELPDEFSKPKAYEAVERALKVVYPEAILGDYGKLYWNETDLIREYEPLAKGNIRPFERKFAVFNLIRLLDGVEGEFAECGAYNGGTAYFMAKAAVQSGKKRIIHLFDSFEGLSSPSAADGDHWFESALSVSEDEARANLKGFRNLHFYKGWIPDRFEEVADRTFSFVHIDVDLYEPTRDSIEFFYPRMAPGGILICDDYGFTQCPGATKAMDEFFADKPERVVHLPTAQALIIKR